MKSYQGIAENVKKSILGKIVKNRHPLFLRNNYIIAIEKINLKSLGYVGIIASRKYQTDKQFLKMPTVFLNEKDFLELKDGDIVVIESNGQINVVWDTNSPHNAILVTEQCNVNCIMCPQPHRKDPEHLYEFNLNLIKLVDPENTKHIGITGGEPTLIGDKLFSIIKACQNRCKKASMQLLTNGIKFKDLEFTRKLAEIQHHDLLVCVSLCADNDIDHDRIIGKKGSFYETIKGLHNLALFRQKVEIRIVIHALNYKRLLQVAEFIYRNFPFVVHVAFMGMETTGLARKNLNRLWIDPVEYMSQLESAVVHLNRRALHVSIYNLQLCIQPKELWRFNRHSISLWKKTYLPECSECDLRLKCGGLFATSGEVHSKHIHSLKLA